jgi:hypothetical protein
MQSSKHDEKHVRASAKQSDQCSIPGVNYINRYITHELPTFNWDLERSAPIIATVFFSSFVVDLIERLNERIARDAAAENFYFSSPIASRGKYTFSCLVEEK